MNTDSMHCIKQYIEQRYEGGLIGISDLAEYCGVLEGKIYKALIQLDKQENIKIVKRYFCPEGHQILLDDLPYCSDCNYPYSQDFITTIIYVKPLVFKPKSY
jgi:hypothetical protein